MSALTLQRRINCISFQKIHKEISPHKHKKGLISLKFTRIQVNRGDMAASIG